LRVRLHTRTRRSANGQLFTEHRVTEVLEHIPAPRPARLPLDDPTE
jgi:hypothetical protein